VASEVGKVLAAQPGTQAASFGLSSGAVESLPEDTPAAVKLGVGLAGAALPLVPAGVSTLRTSRNIAADVPTRSTTIPETGGRPITQPQVSVGKHYTTRIIGKYCCWITKRENASCG